MSQYWSALLHIRAFRKLEDKLSRDTSLNEPLQARLAINGNLPVSQSASPFATKVQRRIGVTLNVQDGLYVVYALEIPLTGPRIINTKSGIEKKWRWSKSLFAE